VEGVAVSAPVAPIPTLEASGRRSFARPKSRTLTWPRDVTEVRWFDIAMDDALSVRGVQRVGNLCADVQKPGRVEGLLSDVMLERLALE